MHKDAKRRLVDEILALPTNHFQRERLEQLAAMDQTATLKKIRAEAEDRFDVALREEIAAINAKLEKPFPAHWLPSLFHGQTRAKIIALRNDMRATLGRQEEEARERHKGESAAVLTPPGAGGRTTFRRNVL